MNPDTKLEKLIEFLGVCPVCISGYVKSSESDHFDGRAFASVLNTWDETLTRACSNKTCTYILKVGNPNYVPQPPDTSSSEDSSVADIFG